MTFRYSENSLVGLLSCKRAILVVASGGTDVGSGIDLASPLRHVLAFAGITGVTVIAADRLMVQGEAARAAAVAEIMKLACAGQQTGGVISARRRTGQTRLPRSPRSPAGP
jgi:FMN-dependent NADH-azoreductase